MGRPFNTELIKNWKLSLRASLAARVELALWDKINKKPEYGKRAELIEALLEEWLAGKLPHLSIQPRTPE